MKKALIIGSAGFVGPYLAKTLLRNEWKVTATKLENEKLLIDDVKIINLNILNREEIENILKAEKPDYIFHLAAQSSVALSWKRPDITIDINIKGASNLFEAIHNCKINPRVLLVGSSEEYGVVDGDGKVSEQRAISPENYYAVTKVCQEMIGKIYVDAYGMDVMATRSFNHIGPGQAPTFVIPDFCKQVADIESGLQEPVIKTGNLEVMRDFTDVRDVVEAYRLIMENGHTGEIYNVGSGHAVTIQSLLEEILSQAKCGIAIEINPARFRPIDVPKIEADVTKLQRHTGWKPVISISQTVSEVLEQWRSYNRG